jgi:polysaccharide deacetylase 2 family uncharacterized protein YibQ
MAKQPHRRGRSRGWSGYLLSFLLGALLALGGYAYLTREKPLSPETFSQKAFLVDQIIQSQLYEIGIPRKDILLHQSAPKREQGFAWKESILKIQVPRTLPFSLIEDKLKQGLSPLGKKVVVHSSRSTESLQLDIRFQNRTTHQLTFIVPPATTTKRALRPRIAIVIDDLGGENKISQELLRWDLPITFSILPFGPYSKTLARKAHRKGKEIILHLPMEPHGYPQTKPGEGVLLEEMDEAKLLHQLSKDIEAVPYIKGVSNHMGSRLMENPEKVKIVLSELKRRKLFFLDSRTTPQTVGVNVAQGLGMKAMERTLFIDHSVEEEDIEQKIEKLIQLSFSNGKAIGIGHPHPSTLKSLKEMIPKIKEKGIDLVPLSAVME